MFVYISDERSHIFTHEVTYFIVLSFIVRKQLLYILQSVISKSHLRLLSLFNLSERPEIKNRVQEPSIRSRYPLRGGKRNDVH